MRHAKRRDVQVGCEALEGRALLSGVHAALHKSGHLHEGRVSGGRTSAEIGRASPTVTSPGIGASATTGAGTALSFADTKALQQDASANNLEMFLTQLAILKDTQAAVQQDASTLLTDDRNIDFQVHTLADAKGVVVPSDIMTSDQPLAKQVMATVNTTNFDQTYLKTMVQAETQRIGQIQQQISGVQDTAVKSYLQATLPVVQAHLASEQALVGSTSTGTGSAPATTPSSTTLSSTDLQILESSYSTTLMERFLAQFTDLQSSKSEVQMYASKLVEDHEQEVLEIDRYAAATGTYLPASIQGTNVQTSLKVLSSANKSRYDVNYLKTMVQSHTMDIMDNMKTIATTQNPTLVQFAQDDIPTDFLHRGGAQLLLRK